MSMAWAGKALTQATLRVKWTGSSVSVALRLPELPPTASMPQGPAPALASPGCGHAHHATPAPEHDALQWDGLLKGVQKQKNSHQMTRTRNSANSKLHPTVALVHCPGCGRAKLAHHLCEFCFSQINRWQKLEFGRSNKERDTLLKQIDHLPVVPNTGKPQLASHQRDEIEAPKDTPPHQQ